MNKKIILLLLTSSLKLQSTLRLKEKDFGIKTEHSIFACMSKLPRSDSSTPISQDIPDNQLVLINKRIAENDLILLGSCTKVCIIFITVHILGLNHENSEEFLLAPIRHLFPRSGIWERIAILKSEQLKHCLETITLGEIFSSTSRLPDAINSPNLKSQLDLEHKPIPSDNPFEIFERLDTCENSVHTQSSGFKFCDLEMWFLTMFLKELDLDRWTQILQELAIQELTGRLNQVPELAFSDSLDQDFDFGNAFGCGNFAAKLKDLQRIFHTIFSNQTITSLMQKQIVLAKSPEELEGLQASMPKSLFDEKMTKTKFAKISITHTLGIITHIEDGVHQVRFRGTIGLKPHMTTQKGNGSRICVILLEAGIMIIICGNSIPSLNICERKLPDIIRKLARSDS